MEKLAIQDKGAFRSAARRAGGGGGELSALPWRDDVTGNRRREGLAEATPLSTCSLCLLSNGNFVAHTQDN